MEHEDGLREAPAVSYMSVLSSISWNEGELLPRPRFRHKTLILAISAVWLLSVIFGYQSALLVASILGLLVAIAGFNRPFVGMLGLGMLATLDPITRGLLADDGIWRWNTFNYLLLAIALFSLNSLFKKTSIQHGFLLVLVLLLALELPISEDFANGWQQLLGVASAFGFAAYLIKLGPIPGIWYSLGIVNGFLGASAGFLYYLERDNLPYLNPNAFVHSPLAALFSVCLAFLEARSTRDIGSLVILGGLNMIWVFLSGSRGGMLLGLVGMLYCFIRMKKIAGSKSIPAILLVSGAAVLFLGTFSILGDNASLRVLKLFDSDRSMANKTSGRSDIAFAGWEIFKSHPLGVGTGGFDLAFADLDVAGLAFAGHQKQAHSAWVKILSENGIPGIALLLLFIGSFFTMAIRVRIPGVRGLGLLTATTLTVGFLSTEFQSKDLWLLAMSVAAILGEGMPRRELSDAALICREEHEVQLENI